MLLPIPLNVYQLTLYLPYGVVNSVYQVTVLTAVSCLSLQSLLFHRKQQERKKKRKAFSSGMIPVRFTDLTYDSAGCSECP